MLCAASQAAPITARQATETARIMELRDGGPVSVSPDGERFALMLVRGDVAKDGVWLESLSGNSSSIATTGAATLKARLLSRGLGDPENLWKTQLTLPRGNSLTWQDVRHVLFFWPDANSTVQVFRVNVDSGEMAQVTQQQTDVSTFALAMTVRDELMFSARAPLARRDPQSDGRGFAVRSVDVFSLLRDGGGASSLLDRWNIEWFVQSPNSAARRIAFPGRTQSPSMSFLVKASPDGRYALVDGAPEQIPASWLEYRDGWLHRQVREALEVSPKAFIARQIMQLYLVDLDADSARPLVNAPLHRSGYRNVVWSPDSRSIVVGPTFIPLDLIKEAGGSQEGVLHLDIASGQVTVLPSLPTVAPRVRPRVRFEIRQSLNDPPRLFVHDLRKGARE